MFRTASYIFFFIAWSCSQTNQHPVSSVFDTDKVYEEQLKLINEKLTEEKGSKVLYYKKLYASQQLGWSEDVRKELNELILQEGLDYQLYQYAGDFYLSRGYYSELNSLVDRWLRMHKPSRNDLKWKILGLREMGQKSEASAFLWSFFQKSDQKEDLLFVASEYLRLHDTTHAIMAYHRVAKLDPAESRLLSEYVPLLLSTGYPQRAKELLVYQKDHITDPSGHLLVAKTLYQLGEMGQAVGIANQYDSPESHELLADWYHRDQRWDSALYYSNKLIQIDSSRASILKRATILEDRGWLESALRNFNMLIEANPEDSIARSRAEIVEGKIAYLRRMREMRQKIPVLTIPSKKSIED